MRTSLRYGLFAGAAIVVLNALLWWLEPSYLVRYAGYGGWVLYLGFMYAALLRVRGELGERLSLGAAFRLAWPVFVVGSLFEAAVNHLMLQDPAVQELVREVALEQARALGREEAIGRIEAMDFGAFHLSSALLQYFQRLLFPGAIFALVAALMGSRR